MNLLFSFLFHAGLPIKKFFLFIFRLVCLDWILQDMKVKILCFSFFLLLLQMVLSHLLLLFFLP